MVDRLHRIYCWGSNAQGELGQPAAIEASLPLLAPAEPSVAVAPGIGYTCAISDEGTVSCWGERAAVAFPEPLPAVRRVARLLPSEFYLCAIDTSGVVSCVGSLFTELRLSPTATHSRAVLDFLPEGVVDLVDNGVWGFYALMSSGEVLAWGTGRSLGPLIAGPDWESTYSEIVGPFRIPGLPPVRVIGCGSRGCCGATDGDEVWCWGQSPELVGRLWGTEIEFRIARVYP